jgi:hypothetical protein
VAVAEPKKPRPKFHQFRQQSPVAGIATSLIEEPVSTPQIRESLGLVLFFHHDVSPVDGSIVAWVVQHRGHGGLQVDPLSLHQRVEQSTNSANLSFSFG